MRIIFFVWLLTSTTSLYAATFYNCNNKYALCTTASCEKIHGKKDLVSCHCQTKIGYSAGNQSCRSLQSHTHGTTIYSRYYPIKSYKVCHNDRAWAWCLDKPCKINKAHPKQATCICNLVSKQGPYLIVLAKGVNNHCQAGITSSATVTQMVQMNDFLKTQSTLKPFPATVIEDK